ncbi:MAG: PHP domain-containing protein [Elusimicrobiota bacterium]
MRRVELHAHSACSDGTCEPEEVVRRAHLRGAVLFALTDHDTVEGVSRAREAAKACGLPFAGAVELNTRDGDNIHILGYGVDVSDAAFLARLEDFRARRHERMRRIIERLRENKVDVAFEELLAQSQGSRRPLGRPHVADLLRSKGVVSGRKQAFMRFLAPGRPAYVEPLGPTVREAIEAVRNAGGFAALAHPNEVEEETLSLYQQWGLEGLEVYYPIHRHALEARLLACARRRGLFVTGGSDFHGPKTGREKIATAELPQDVFDALMERLFKKE